MNKISRTQESDVDDDKVEFYSFLIERDEEEDASECPTNRNAEVTE